MRTFIRKLELNLTDEKLKFNSGQGELHQKIT